MLNDYQIKGHTVWHTPCLAWAKDFSTNKSRVWAAGAGLSQRPTLLCVMTQREPSRRFFDIQLSWNSFCSSPCHVHSLCGPRYPAMTYCGPGTDIDITLRVNNQYGHALSQTPGLSDVLFSGNFERRMKIDPRRTWPRLSADWRHWVFAWGPWCHLPSFIETHKKFEEFFVFQTVMKIWGFNNWTFRQKMKVPHQIIYNETLRTTASLHIWILFSEFINLGGWLQRKIKFLST